MKKLLFILGICLLIAGNAWSANAWRGGTGSNTILGGSNAADIDSNSFQKIVDPLDRLLTNYREGAKLAYSSTIELTVSAGELMLSNASGTIRLMVKNTSSTTVTWADLDTGSEPSSTTCYVYATVSAASDAGFIIKISVNATTPDSGAATYYTRLGSFYNNSSSNILNDETITNDNNLYALQLGDWITKSLDTSYLASTDGFVCAYSSGTTDNIVIIYTDSSNPPTTVRQRFYKYGDGSGVGSIMCPVKKGDYYKATNTKTCTLYWIPNEN